MSQYDSGIKCPVCGEANIVAEVESVATESLANIPIGPGSRSYFQLKIIAFHCGQCQILFYSPPGKPDARNEILRQARRDQISNGEY